jgi:hypothetical protein
MALHASLRLVLVGLLLCEAGCGVRSGAPQPGPEGRSLSIWHDRTPAGGPVVPNAGEDFALVYDPRGHRVLSFGGKNDENVNLAEVWALDLESRVWEEIVPSEGTPPPREDHSVVYDALGHRAILYGGEDGPTTNDTWAFDLESHAWRDLTRPDAPRREDHTAVYDSHRKRMIVFGGQDREALGTDVWELDLDPESPTFETWLELETRGRRPQARYDHSAVYDPSSSRMVIFGGWDDEDEDYLDDTWALHPEEGTWRRIKTKRSNPSARRHAAAVYAGDRNWFVIQGGFGDKGYLNDVWAFDLTANIWLNLTPGPQPRIDHGAIYDPRARRLVVYGGDARLDPKFKDVWELEIRPDLPLEELLDAAGAKRKKKR